RGWHGACTSKKRECVIDMAKIHANAFGKRNVHVRATFIADAPGSRDHPIPIGTTATVGAGLQVRVNSTATVPLSSPPPPPGAYYFDANLTVTNTGRAAQPPVAAGWLVWSKHNALYNLTPIDFFDRCPVTAPTPVLDLTASIPPGQTTTGHLCWTVAANDADSLELIFG